MAKKRFKRGSVLNMEQSYKEHISLKCVDKENEYCRCKQSINSRAENQVPTYQMSDVLGMQGLYKCL